MDFITKVILEIKEKHNINLSKETFKSFMLLKPHIDILISKIIMGSPILVSNVEAIEFYTPNNSDYKKTPEFRQTFQMDDDGFEDLTSIKLVRYVKFIKYLTTLLGWKFNFTMVDVLEPKPQRLASLISLFSDNALFVSSSNNDIKETIATVATDKVSQVEYLESYLKQERELLKDIGSYESLLSQQDDYLQKYELESARYKKLILKLEHSKAELLKEDQHELHLKGLRDGEKAKLQKHNDELSKLREQLVESPEKLVVELSKVKSEIETENNKLENYFATCSEFKTQLDNGYLIAPFLQLFTENVADVKRDFENLRQIDLKLAGLCSSKSKQIVELLKAKEKSLRSVEKCKQKMEACQRNIEANEKNVKACREDIAAVKDLTENERMKIANYRNVDLARQIEEKRSIRASAGEEYKQEINKLEKNIDKSLDEILDNYRKI